jgi:hypothetical protein
VDAVTTASEARTAARPRDRTLIGNLLGCWFMAWTKRNNA